MKFIIVDDSPTFREGLSFVLKKDKNNEIIGMANNGKEFLELTNIYKADIILMDINMPEMNGADAVKTAMWRYPLLKVIAITMFNDTAYMKELIEVGFKGCVFKSDIYRELPKAIEIVKNGQFYFPQNIKISEFDPNLGETYGYKNYNDEN